jgi:hypothetical protein
MRKIISGFVFFSQTILLLAVVVSLAIIAADRFSIELASGSTQSISSPPSSGQISAITNADYLLLLLINSQNLYLPVILK